MSKFRRWTLNAIAGVATAVASVLPSYGQSHDFNFKARELTRGTGANIENVKVDLNNGEYIGFTNSQGEVSIKDVPQGTYSITISKQGFIQFVQNNYVIDADKNFNASIPKKTRVGPWGTDEFNVTGYKNTFRTVGTLGQNKDPPHWKQIAPINNRLKPGQYSQSDSLLVVEAINTLESGTGYNLITLVPSSTSADTTYTIELNSYTNVSGIGTDVNNIIFAGNSKITVTSQKKRIIHETNKQFDMWPYFTPNVPSAGSVMDPDVATITDPKPWDLDNIAITMDQHYAKARGEQNLFLGNMQEFVAPGVPAQTSNIKPANGSSGLNKIVEVAWNKSAGTNKYHVDIATDATFANMVKDLLVQRIDTLITLENGKTYFMRVRAENDAGNSLWSSTTTFSTETTAPVLPGQASISTPLNETTKVATPAQYTLSAANATSFRVFAARDATFSQMLKDTVVYVVNPQIPLPNGTTIFTKAYGINANGNGLESTIISYTTIKANPTNSDVLTPANNATKVSQQVTFTNNPSLNTEQYRWIIRNHQTQSIVVDTLLNHANGFIRKLQNGETYDVTVQPINSDVAGITSATNTFTIIKGTPNLISMTNPANNATEVNSPVNFTSTTGGQFAEGYKYEIKTSTDTPVTELTVNTNETTYNLLGNRSFKVRTWAFNTDVEGQKSAWVPFTTYNHAPGEWNITEPLNNATITFVDKKAKISGTPSIDIDNDNVTKRYHIKGGDLDTLILGANNETIYLDSVRLQPDTQYTINAESTDESKTTPTEIIVFRTPKTITGIDDFEIIKNNMVIYPNPNPKYIKFNQNIEGVTDIDLINMSGQLLRHVYKERQPPGDYLISIDKEGLATGMYLIRKTTQGSQRKQVETGKAIIKE